MARILSKVVKAPLFGGAFVAGWRLLFLGALLVASALPARDCVLVGVGEGSLPTQPAHRCLSFCLGKATVEPPAKLSYCGLLLGLAHNSLAREDIQRVFVDEQCEVTGASVQLFAQTNVGSFRGVAVTGFFSDCQALTGAQMSLLGNRAEEVTGGQVALGLNRAEKRVDGVQVGLVNVAEELHGIQFGLLNVNGAGWVLPLINIGW